MLNQLKNISKKVRNEFGNYLRLQQRNLFIKPITKPTVGFSEHFS